MSDEQRNLEVVRVRHEWFLEPDRARVALEP
jgi:hypothetical protein